MQYEAKYYSNSMIINMYLRKSNTQLKRIIHFLIIRRTALYCYSYVTAENEVCKSKMLTELIKL